MGNIKLFLNIAFCLVFAFLLHVKDIPDSSAIFIEPLAAACEILDQVAVSPERSVLLIGDGKLALLIAIVMQSRSCKLLVLGKHPEKLRLLKDRGIATILPLAEGLSAFEMSRKPGIVKVVLKI
jgi:threonine dehydrogenase-like Zn-dependent dehydrogenase